MTEPLLGLPHDLAVKCLTSLTIRDLLASRATCQQLRAIASDDTLWRPFAGSQRRCGLRLDRDASAFERTVASRHLCSDCVRSIVPGPQKFSTTTWVELEALRNEIQGQWIWPGDRPPASEAGSSSLVLLRHTPHGPRWWTKVIPDADGLWPGLLAQNHYHASVTYSMLTDAQTAAGGWIAVPENGAVPSPSSSPPARLVLPSGMNSYLEDFLVSCLPERDRIPHARGTYSSVLTTKLANGWRALHDVLRSGEVVLLFDIRRLVADGVLADDESESAQRYPHPILALHVATGRIVALRELQDGRFHASYEVLDPVCLP